jgi:uncharacterized protein involved in oxidation of intracellular sulfur
MIPSKMLFVMDDALYVSECMRNALRLAPRWGKEPTIKISIFLMADAVIAATAGQRTSGGYYNIERMLTGAGGRFRGVVVRNLLGCAWPR